MAQTADKPTASVASSAAKTPSAKSASKPAARKMARPAAKKATPVAKRASAAPAKSAKPAKAPKAVKPKADAPVAKSAPKAGDVKQKLVRDSFTMPRADFDLIDKLKARALAFHRPAKKSELLRAGLQALAALGDAELAKSLSSLTPLKAGRPKKQA